MTVPRIDVHFHYLPGFYRQALADAGHGHPDGMPAIPEWSASSALATMNRLGVQTALLSVSSPGIHFGDGSAALALARRINDEGARLKRAYPGRFGFFAITPLPDVDGAIAEAVRALDELGADGVSVETNHNGVYLGDERMEPFYQALHARKAAVFIHPTSPSCPCAESLAAGCPRPMLEFRFETARSVSQMILSGVTRRFSDMRIIVPHAGAALPVLASRMEALVPLLGGSGDPPNFKEEMAKLHYDLAGAPLPELLGALLQIVAPGRLLYGSDWPFTPAEACAVLAQKLDATPLLAGALLAQAMRGNAQALFPQLTSQAAAG